MNESVHFFLISVFETKEMYIKIILLHRATDIGDKCDVQGYSVWSTILKYDAILFEFISANNLPIFLVKF